MGYKCVHLSKGSATRRSIPSGPMVRGAAESEPAAPAAGATAATPTRFETEVVDHGGLLAVRDAWKALSLSALEPNVFHDPDFALPAIRALGRTESIRATLVWSRDDGRGPTLVGLFLFTVSRRWGVPIGVGEAFIHPYAMSSAPLVDPGMADGVLAAFLDWLDAGGGAPAAWLFRFLPQDGPLFSVLSDRAGAAGAGFDSFGAYDRAVLDGACVGADGFAATLSARRRKEYRRLGRRLAGHGDVSLTQATAPDAVRDGVAAYLALEASGWKGRHGTAAALGARTREMFETIADTLGRRGQMRVDALRLDGRPLAMALSCGVGRTWWLWKISYDEAFARYSPGVLTVIDVSETAAATGACYDSCALPGIAMIERLWPGRRPYADTLIVPRRRAGAVRALAPRLEALRRHAEAAAKRVRALVRPA